MSGKVLHIFDFDGTLFRSPDPNPRLWAANLLGKIKSPPSQSGLGWYQELITLLPPYVDENPGISWFNPPLLEKCINSLADPNAITVLLTGRQIVYEERVKHILRGANLHFHHYGLKPGNFIFTLDYKLNFIGDLIQKYKPDLSKVIIYEDRVEHASKFETFLRRQQIESEVVQVVPNVTYLTRDAEVELVKALIAKNSPNMEIVPVPTYTGLILDEASRKNLLSWITPPPGWTITAHHMTIALGSQPLPEEQMKLGDKGEVEITHVGFDTRSLVAKVAGLPSSNPIPHVTIAHAPTARPVDSNHVREWVAVEDLARNGGVLVQTEAEVVLVEKEAEVVEVVGAVSEATASTESHTISIAEITTIEPTPTPSTPPTPFTPHILHTHLPPQARLSGAIHTETMFTIANPVRPNPHQFNKIPKGVSLGELVKRHHPNAQGRTIGGIVSRVRDWAQAREDEVRVEEIEYFIKSMDISNL